MYMYIHTVHVHVHVYIRDSSFPPTSIEGDTQGFTDTYLQALAHQLKAQRSVGSDVEELVHQPLPYELYIEIFSYLSPRDVCRCMRVCKVQFML